MGKRLEKEVKERAYLDNQSLPTRSGVYLTRGIWGDSDDDEPKEIDVYNHPIKGLCCFSEDFGSEGTGVDDRYDCHISVQFTGLTFIRRVGRLR